MWPHVAADLEHDLRVTAKWNRSNVPAPPAARDVRVHSPAESGKARACERLSPHAKEIADRRILRGYDLDHARRRRRPHRVGATRTRHVRTVTRQRRRHSDSGGQNQHAPVREQLDVRTNPRPRRRSAAKPADGLGRGDAGRRRRKPIQRPDADRRRDRSAATQRTEQRRDDASTEHAERIDTSFVATGA